MQVPPTGAAPGFAPWAGVFALALALRLAHLALIRDTALFATPIGDARAYLDWARALAGGDWLGREVFYQAPLYPYFLGVLQALFGDGPWPPRVAQVLLGSAACVLIGQAGARFVSRRAGLLAGVALAVYAPAIYFDGLIQKAALDGFLLAALCWAFARQLEREAPLAAFGSGLLVGLLALSRENALVLAPVAALFVAFAGPARPPARRALALAALALGLALPLVPVGLRNQALGGDFLLTTAQLGPNLWIGNRPGASGRYEPLVPGRGDARFERADARALAEREAGRALTPAEVSDHFRDRALAFAREQPAAWLALQARKWALVWNARELPDTEGIEAYRQASLVLRALQPLFGFGLLAALAAAGVVATRSDWRRLAVLYATLATLAASIALFFVFARYRYSLVPPLALFAGAGLAALYAALRERRFGAAAGPVLAALATAAFSAWPLAAADDVALTHFSVGSALLERGRPADAIPELERALEARPGFAHARIRLADALRDTGQASRALALYDQVIAGGEGAADAHVGRGLLLGALGRREAAALEFERALALEPNHADAHNDLGNALLDQGRSDEALAHYDAALALQPANPDFLANRGAGLLRAGRAAESLAELQRALAFAPGHRAARLSRAMALESLGRADEARTGYAEVVSAEAAGSPYAELARQGLARLGSR